MGRKKRAGYYFAKSTWTGLLLCAFALIAAGAGVFGFLEHFYILAALPPVFFVGVMLWLGRKWMNPRD